MGAPIPGVAIGPLCSCHVVAEATPKAGAEEHAYALVAGIGAGLALLLVLGVERLRSRTTR